jgi:hypothetical protein
MKKLLSIAMLGLFCAAVVGCHASADVDSPDDGMDSHTTYKKTEYKANGDTKTTKTEVKHEND